MASRTSVWPNEIYEISKFAVASINLPNYSISNVDRVLRVKTANVFKPFLGIPIPIPDSVIAVTRFL